MIMRIWITIFVLLSATTALGGTLDVKFHEISIEITPADHSLEASDQMSLSVDAPGRYVLLINEHFRIDKVTVNGKGSLVTEVLGDEVRTYFKNRPQDDFNGVKGIQLHLLEAGEHIVVLTYNGVVYDELEVPDYSRGAIPEETTGLIGEEGIYLTGTTHWYPDVPDDFAHFSIRTVTPPDFEAVTEGRRVYRGKDKDTFRTEWDISYPTKEVTLVAGKYILQEMELDGITLMAYFFPSEEDLIAQYLGASKRYVGMYNSLIGPYPFSKFAVVENFFPTGYGMPSYTLLGRRVVRLPFIIHTSLGHEVAHNWWGNCVYPDYSKGNWCEGLTVYFADYRYKQAISDSAAIDYRRTLAIDFTTYVNESNDFPLSEFQERTTPASRAIGYGKCAFLFHMLERMVGEEPFYRTLRHFYSEYQFKVASWQDIENIFEKTSGRSLTSFFEQWVQRTGAPLLSLAGAKVDSTDGAYSVQLNLAQKGDFEIAVPVRVECADTTVNEEVWLTTADTMIVLDLASRPIRLSIDPEYDCFRKLDPMEVPPTISGILGEEGIIIVLPTHALPAKRKAFEGVASQLNRTGESTVMDDSTVTIRDMADHSLIIMGNREENLLLSVMPLSSGMVFDEERFGVAGEVYDQPGHGAFVTFRSAFNPEKLACVVVGQSTEAVSQSGHKIIHYGKYSYVTFLDGNRITAGVFPAENNPLTVSFD